jgi:hypothetical protein
MQTFFPPRTNPLSLFTRTITTSFGSICFGSLLVALVQALRALANQARAEVSYHGHFLIIGRVLNLLVLTFISLG